MADKTTHQLLDGLRRAATEPAGLPLFAKRGAAGLFPVHAAGKLAAQRGKDEGYLRVVRTEPRGKTVQELCTLTDKGVAYLLREGSSRALLEDLVRALEGREAQAAELLTLVRGWQAGLADLRALTKALIPAATNNGQATRELSAAADQAEILLRCLHDWHACGVTEDCPLPELYRRAREHTPALTLGNFHDALRALHERERIYLHPWTGPLYDLPEPACALLSGHEVAYYASLRG